MFVFSQKLARSLAAILGLAAAVPSVALAQMAPTGEHYAARASDTGFAGAVNSSGGYGTSVPLDLPGARGGLSVPLWRAPVRCGGAWLDRAVLLHSPQRDTRASPSGQ